MLTTAQLRCPVFDRLTGRLQPPLKHPTSLEFDPKIWVATIADDMLGERDADLVRAAIYIGGFLESVRSELLDGLFDGLSGDQRVVFAVANANRAWNIFRWKVNLALPNGGDEMTYSSTIGLEGIPVGPNGTLMDPNHANNAVVDALPYWLDQATEPDGGDKALDLDDMRLLMARGHMTANFLQTFRAFWQQILWEPWGFDYNEAAAVMTPRARDDLARWRAWEWRDQILAAQSSLLSRNLEKDLAGLELALPLTACAIEPDGIEVCAPDAITAAMHRSALENLRKSYAAPFLEEPVGADPRMTPILLEKAVCVLQDLAGLRLPRDIDPAAKDLDDPRDFACAFPRTHLLDFLSAALAIDPALAELCLDYLTADPFGNLNPLFNTGLWHKPLVRSRDGTTVMIVAGALVWGSSTRRLDRWLQDAYGDADLSKTPAGLRFEAALRQALEEAVGRNPLLIGIPTGVASIAQGEAREEVDVLLRIGSTILVCEVKCLVAPSEPIDRNNHIRKLERACHQASRKAKWLADNRNELDARLGDGAGAGRIQPLVVLNQSNGVEWEYEGCPITDMRFLELLLASGQMAIGGALLGEPGKLPVLVQRTLYATAAELEEAIQTVFLAMPGMDPFRHSVSWGDNVLSLPNGHSFIAQTSKRDGDAYIEQMNKLMGIARR